MESAFLDVLTSYVESYLNVSACIASYVDVCGVTEVKKLYHMISGVTKSNSTRLIKTNLFSYNQQQRRLKKHTSTDSLSNSFFLFFLDPLFLKESRTINDLNPLPFFLSLSEHISPIL
jgi:hypothetical protein